MLSFSYEITGGGGHIVEWNWVEQTGWCKRFFSVLWLSSTALENIILAQYNNLAESTIM